MGMEVFSCRENATIPGAHKIGAAVSGPRIAGKNFYGHEAFSDRGRKYPPEKSIQNEKVKARFLQCGFCETPKF